MKFTDLFVKRPVLAIVINLVILIAGLQAIRSLSVRQYPRSDIAVVSVSTVYVGASADLVRGFVTTPIERVIASADGIDYMESTSAQGLSTILVHLKINYDTTAALTQIQAKVAQVRNDLPPEAQIPVIDLETADTQFAAMYIGVSSPDLDQNQITDYLTRVVQPKLSAISGVQRADILGNRTFAMRLWLKPQEMAARGGRLPILGGLLVQGFHSFVSISRWDSSRIFMIRGFSEEFHYNSWEAMSGFLAKVPESLGSVQRRRPSTRRTGRRRIGWSPYS